MILQSLPAPIATIAKPEKGERVDSISSLASTEAPSVESSIGDDETSSDTFSEGDETEEHVLVSQCTVIREEEEEVSTDDVVGLKSDTTSEVRADDSEVHTDTVVETPKAPTLTRRRSSLKPVEETIPLRNSGWKNLPKLTIPVQKTLQKKDSSSSSLSQRSESKKMVQFGTIEIRSYDLCIGDNPSVSYGTPVSLDWTYETVCSGDISVDVYESRKPRQRRNLRQMMMNSYHRRHVLLLHWNATEADCVAAERAVNRLRNQRCLTKALLPLQPLEDCVTSCVRKVKRLAGPKRG